MNTLLTAHWTNLAVATYRADHNLLKAHLPRGTEIANWNGNCYMSIVAFLFEKPAFLGIPSPFFRKFEEVNLRFYVRRKAKEGWRKGVVFIREISPSRIIGTVAKWLYGEKFTSLPMQHSIKKDINATQVSYTWQLPGSTNCLEMTHSNEHFIPGNGSLESYIHDHFYAYTALNDTTREFTIEHRPWNIHKGLSFGMKVDAKELYGQEFVEYLQGVPESYFLMDGSFTKVSFPHIIH